MQQAAARARAIADPAVGPRTGLQHVGEVFGAHGGGEVGIDPIGADNGRHGGGGGGRFGGAVDGGGIAGNQPQFGLGAMGRRHARAQALQAPMDGLPHLIAEIAQAAAQHHAGRNHIPGFAAMELGDTHHRRIRGGDVAAGDRLQGLHQGAAGHDRIDALLGHGGMAAAAAQFDFELVAARHHRPWAHGKTPLRQAGPVVQAVDRLHRETLEQALLHHHPAAALVFFGRLEDQYHGAVKASGFGQVLGGPQQHGGVAVVAAGVHAARVAGAMGKGVGLGDRQGIHVGPQADAGLAGAGPQHPDHAGAGQAGVHLTAEAGEPFGHQGGGAVFCEGRFGMGVQVPPPGGHGWGQVLQTGDQRHGGRRLRPPTPATRYPPAGAGW